MNPRLISAIGAALLAAVANGMFVYGQRRSEVAENPFLFMLFALLACTALFGLAVVVSPRTHVRDYLSRNYLWILLSGIGLFFTFIGFYLLYSRYGASYYTLYAVLSIVTTSVVVGVVILKEGLNVYHILAVVTALATVALFALGQNKALN